MSAARSLIDKLSNSKPSLNIKLNSPAHFSDILRLEELLEMKFPSDFKDFYALADGFETNDYSPTINCLVFVFYNVMVKCLLLF